MKIPLPKALRVLIPAVLIVAWLVGASIGGNRTFGKVREDLDERPDELSAGIGRRHARCRDCSTISSGLTRSQRSSVFASDDELSDETLADLEATVADLPEIEGLLLMSFHP